RQGPSTLANQDDVISPLGEGPGEVLAIGSPRDVLGLSAGEEEPAPLLPNLDRPVDPWLSRRAQELFDRATELRDARLGGMVLGRVLRGRFFDPPSRFFVLEVPQYLLLEIGLVGVEDEVLLVVEELVLAVPLCVREEQAPARRRLEDPEVEVVRDVAIEDDLRARVDLGRLRLLELTGRALDVGFETVLLRDLEDRLGTPAVAPDERDVDLTLSSDRIEDPRVAVERQPPCLPEKDVTPVLHGVEGRVHFARDRAVKLRLLVRVDHPSELGRREPLDAVGAIHA